MNKIFYIIIGVLITACIYLTTQAFNSSTDADPYQSDTPYNQDIDGTVSFGDFTTFSIQYNSPSACNASCGPGEIIQTVRGCYGNDGVSYSYSICGGNPGSIRTPCNAGTCYTGTWSANAAPGCSGGCGTGGYTSYGSVTCSGGTCNPATRPGAQTAWCPATAACPANCTFLRPYGWWVNGNSCIEGTSGSTPMSNGASMTVGANSNGTNGSATVQCLNGGIVHVSGTCSTGEIQ